MNRKTPPAFIADCHLGKLAKYFTEFEICSKCERVYWRGDHYKRMMLTIDAI